MGLSRSILAYTDCKEFLERATDAVRGARIPFRDEAAAEYWRMRCNQFRSLDREQNKIIHELGTKMHGVSEYDMLTMTIKYSPDGFHWVYAEKRMVDHAQIEDIPEDDRPLEVDFEEVKMLEAPSDDNEVAE